jgi:16S rRNA (uracil1498-N3)-methyltransferase
MRHRFFIDRDLEAGAVVALAGEERHHARVLRVREGEEVEVFNGRGTSWLARYDSAEAILLLGPAAGRELRLPLHLAMSIINLEKFELVLQKATELGVASIIPLVTERCEIRPERYRGKAERWDKIVFEAAKQSGRAVIPKVEAPTEFAEAIKRDGMRIIFDADEPPSATQQLSNPATLFIGPEGGWSEAELKAARSHDCAFQLLGPRRLRAETAGIVSVALTAARLNDI